MGTRKLTNISLSQYEAFLELAGCHLIRQRGGHDVYARADLDRPIVVQSHITPVPERIIKQGLRSLGLSKDDLFDLLEGRKEIVRNSPQGRVFTLREL